MTNDECFLIIGNIFKEEPSLKVSFSRHDKFQNTALFFCCWYLDLDLFLLAEMTRKTYF